MSPKGNYYIDASYDHAGEIISLLIKDESLRTEAKRLALETEPLLHSMLNGQQAIQPPYLEKALVEMFCFKRK